MWSLYICILYIVISNTEIYSSKILLLKVCQIHGFLVTVINAKTKAIAHYTGASLLSIL